MYQYMYHIRHEPSLDAQNMALRGFAKADSMQRPVASDLPAVAFNTTNDNTPLFAFLLDV